MARVGRGGLYTSPAFLDVSCHREWPAHWLDHPCDEPVVSFEVGFWTYESIRNRKVYDVNWVLEAAWHRPAKPPGSVVDRLKHRFFDMRPASITRKESNIEESKD